MNGDRTNSNCSEFNVLQTTSLQVQTDLTELKQVLSWFNHVAESILSRAILIQCQTLLAEGFTNAVRHAHHNRSPETPINIQITFSDRELEIRIWDYGFPFDLEDALNHLSDGADKFSAGGRGLGLLKQMSDQVQYIRTLDCRNCLIVVKNYCTKN